MSSLPLPRLHHPIRVKIRKADQGETKYDRQAREPIGKAVRSPEVSMYAQISWKSEKVSAEREGNVITTDGYVLFLKTDLVTEGIDIAYQDQIIEIGEGVSLRPVNLYIEMIQYRGHNPNYGGYTLLKAWFSDKSPVRHS